VVTGTGQLVAVYGKVATDGNGELVGPDDPSAEVRQVFENLRRCLAAAGLSAALAGCAGSFLFVSSGNVYADHSRPGDDESAALLPALARDVIETMETHGKAKVAGVAASAEDQLGG
jgi:enamine deaminase RidA (YjgF/YER057c/UK114 family)